MRVMKKISVSENSSGTVKVIIGDVLEELSFAEFNKLTDKCIELRNVRKTEADIRERATSGTLERSLSARTS